MTGPVTYVLIALWPISGQWIERHEAATTRASCEVAAYAAVNCPKCKPLDVDGVAQWARCEPGNAFANPHWGCIEGRGVPTEAQCQ